MVKKSSISFFAEEFFSKLGAELLYRVEFPQDNRDRFRPQPQSEAEVRPPPIHFLPPIQGVYVLQPDQTYSLAIPQPYRNH